LRTAGRDGRFEMMPATLRRMTVRMKGKKRARARILPALASPAQLVALATTPPQLPVHFLLIKWPRCQTEPRIPRNKKERSRAFEPRILRSLSQSNRVAEGHFVHRVAASCRCKLASKKFACTSPNGRFAEGVAAITGKPFYATEAIGRNPFAWPGTSDDDDVCVHVHFGMAGNSAVFKEDEPGTTPTARLRMDSSCGPVSHLSAATVQHGT